jgi:hypothetical protein
MPQKARLGICRIESEHKNLQERAPRAPLREKRGASSIFSFVVGATSAALGVGDSIRTRRFTIDAAFGDGRVGMRKRERATRFLPGAESARRGRGRRRPRAAPLGPTRARTGFGGHAVTAFRGTAMQTMQFDRSISLHASRPLHNQIGVRSSFGARRRPRDSGRAPAGRGRAG